MGDHQFEVAVRQGLQPEHYMLDVGCGCLRGGVRFLGYLQPEHYFGIEPNVAILSAGQEAIGMEPALRGSNFSHSDTFDCASFGRTFNLVLMQSVLSHTSMRLLRMALERASAVLEPNGWILATLYLDSLAIPPSDDWTYPVCVKHNPALVMQVLEDLGLRSTQLEEKTPTRQTWLRLERY